MGFLRCDSVLSANQAIFNCRTFFVGGCMYYIDATILRGDASFSRWWEDGHDWYVFIGRLLLIDLKIVGPIKIVDQISKSKTSSQRNRFKIREHSELNELNG